MPLWMMSLVGTSKTKPARLPLYRSIIAQAGGSTWDVYKRQGKGLVTYTKEEFCEHWVSTKTNGEEKGIAVSYTHLDVYKRQA